MIGVGVDGVCARDLHEPLDSTVLLHLEDTSRVNGFGLEVVNTRDIFIFLIVTTTIEDRVVRHWGDRADRGELRKFGPPFKSTGSLCKFHDGGFTLESTRQVEDFAVEWAHMDECWILSPVNFCSLVHTEVVELIRPVDHRVGGTNLHPEHLHLVIHQESLINILKVVVVVLLVVVHRSVGLEDWHIC